MITRGAPFGGVCLRCRLRRVRQLTPIRYVTSDASNAHHPDRLTSNGTDSDGNIVRYSNKNLRKRHVSGNRVLKEAAASLGSDMLGKPAYAIVMRDGGKLRKRKIPFGPDENENEPKSPAKLAATIETLVDSQRKLPSSHEVRSNIDDLRPKTDKVLTRKDFMKLKQLLINGFLSAQLRDYTLWLRAIEERKSQEAATDSSSPPEFPWIWEMTTWLPLQTDASEHQGVSREMQGYALPKTPPKEMAAIRVMRKGWGLSIAELETQLGDIRIKLYGKSFMLLMRGTQRFMNTLGDIWLEPGEKIEVFRNRQTIQIVATKLKAESLIRVLDEAVRSATNKPFPIRLVASEAPDDAVLEELGRITNTHIRKTRGSKFLDVTWIKLKSGTDQDMAHVVFRLLLTALGHQQATTTTLLSPVVSSEHSGRLIVDVTSKAKLAWKDKLAQWARFVHPLTPKEESVANPTLPIKQFELPLEPIERTEPVEESLESLPETESPLHPVKWSNVSRTSTVACFGQVLHSYQSSNPTPLLSDLLASTDRRLFTPATPHPLHVSKFGASDSDGSSPLVTTKSTIVIRFWQCPASDPSVMLTKEASSLAQDAPRAPALELRLAASDHEVKGIESFRAITRAHHTDVMLPSSLVDVRFTQTQYETVQALGRGTTLADWAPLADYLGHAVFDLANGKLETPPRQRFPVPRRLLTAPPSSVSADELHPDDLVDVSYEFVGLEFHRSVTLPYEGHQLTYTSIEAGKGGGRRAEVTLEPIQPLNSTTPATETAGKGTLQENFLECCSRLVADRSLWSGIGDL
ncbi:hypothetical protein F4782DRAFT_514124 [Xylaria castorea]|nr:hypothetical protein F4782DRAFT_514124 [Xylaria castorea]